jgi:serine/threonine protein kinase
MNPKKHHGMQKITSNFYLNDTALLGEGQFGQVYKGYKADEDKDVAVKIFKEDILAQYWKILNR